MHNIKFKYLLCLFLGLDLLRVYSQVIISCDMTRQAFSILSDGNKTSLGAELLIGEYTTNADFSVLMKAENTAEFTNSPEYLVIKQAKFLSKGDIDGVLADFIPAERDQAKKLFADSKGLMKFFSNIESFKMIDKAQFGALIRITYVSGLMNGHHVTLSAYLTEKDGRYLFVTEPTKSQIFSSVAASFPYWKPVGERTISKEDDGQLLDASFVNGGSEFENSKVLIKYRLMTVPGDSTITKSTDPMGKFLEQMITAYQKQDTNQIKSLWPPDPEDQEAIEEMIASDEIQATGEYFKKFQDFQIAFYIKSDDDYWVYINPFGSKDELKLIRILNLGDTFKMTARIPDPFANDILSSEDMAKVLLQQLRR